MAAGESLPFHRVEHVSPAPGGAPVIESHCGFCAFVAAAKTEKIIAVAEAAHDCPRLREFRKKQSAGNARRP